MWSDPTADAIAIAMVAGFCLIVLALALGLAAGAGIGTARAVRRLDSLLLCTFCMFLFVAWFFEPYVVYVCGWEGLRTEGCQRHLINRLWLFYADTFDPIFLNLPLWLRICCSLDTILFGPFYAASVYAFATGAQEARWYVHVALPSCGALAYSTLVYFAYEFIAERHRASLLWVFVINLPWTLAPILLLVRLALLRRDRVKDAPYVSHVDESFYGAERGRYSGQVDEHGLRHGTGEMRYEVRVNPNPNPNPSPKPKPKPKPNPSPNPNPNQVLSLAPSPLRMGELATLEIAISLQVI